ncbi:putative membrane protein YtaB [Halobacillus andaensis]|uniref:Membrane protein YtaB n=1 Tax=Halobacillus andaensis TaxID=1176239 RepID=A0A917F1A7_HALAA|nr:tryptophan-rich sensory protein [Halobacillus andaensis]MBP2005612.1 tryptophan-rich sensory protein [Halobacillus andaensis]GGF32863.1 putative membrane protein YtaB [Halobacillus andaensis]
MVKKFAPAILSFIIIYISFSLAGFLFPIDQSWYDQLKKPSWTPTGGTIGIVWAILFAFISLAVSYVIYKKGFKNLPKSLWLAFILNYVCNQLFSYFQFTQKDLLLASIDCVLVAITAIWVGLLLNKISRLSSLLFIPYIAWSTFATFLAFTFYMLNPSMTAF